MFAAAWRKGVRRRQLGKKESYGMNSQSNDWKSRPIQERCRVIGRVAAEIQIATHRGKVPEAIDRGQGRVAAEMQIVTHRVKVPEATEG